MIRDYRWRTISHVLRPLALSRANEFFGRSLLIRYFPGYCRFSVGGRPLAETGQLKKAEPDLLKLFFAQLHPGCGAAVELEDESLLPHLLRELAPVHRDLNSQEGSQNLTRGRVANVRDKASLNELLRPLSRNGPAGKKPVGGDDARSEHRHREVKRHFHLLKVSVCFSVKRFGSPKTVITAHEKSPFQPGVAPSQTTSLDISRPLV